MNVLNPSAISSIADHAMLQTKDISINIPKSSLHRPVQSSDKLDTGIRCRALTTLPSCQMAYCFHLPTLLAGHTRRRMCSIFCGYGGGFQFVRTYGVKIKNAGRSMIIALMLRTLMSLVLLESTTSIIFD